VHISHVVLNTHRYAIAGRDRFRTSENRSSPRVKNRRKSVSKARTTSSVRTWARKSFWRSAAFRQPDASRCTMSCLYGSVRNRRVFPSDQTPGPPTKIIFKRYVGLRKRSIGSSVGPTRPCFTAWPTTLVLRRSRGCVCKRLRSTRPVCKRRRRRRFPFRGRRAESQTYSGAYRKHVSQSTAFWDNLGGKLLGTKIGEETCSAVHGFTGMSILQPLKNVRNRKLK